MGSGQEEDRWTDCTKERRGGTTAGGWAELGVGSLAWCGMAGWGCGCGCCCCQAVPAGCCGGAEAWLGMPLAPMALRCLKMSWWAA